MQLSPHKPTAWLLLMAMIAFMTGAQLLFKSAGLHARAHAGLSEGFLLNQAMWLGLIASGMGMVCWLGSLRSLPLSSAYSWTASIYILTPVASSIVFDDTLSPRYFVGIAILAVGIFLSAGGVRQNDRR